MGDILTLASNWIGSHIPLVATVVIPLLTLVVTLIGTARANKTALSAQSNEFDRQMQAQKFERNQQRELKIAEFRQNWINSLRDDLSEFLSLSGNIKKDDYEGLMKCNSVRAHIQMRMNRSDKHYDELIDCMALCMESKDPKLLGEAHGTLTFVGQTLLKEEWERLKHDLASIEASVK